MAASDVKSSTPPPPLSMVDEDMKGWLFKWTNYIKGYQKRWFVLSNGILFGYCNPNGRLVGGGSSWDVPIPLSY
ncbi:oxysterol-binding protein 1 [Aphis craccivora]|uniref:Oxysterol-binding protein 1 n=1 Tax=Aphis craccivora TaxID=307492 RepID=A0A6G0ZLU4_APHCR|nr:oxysterol-binding protein 1 [Aphis craccivora]